MFKWWRCRVFAHEQYEHARVDCIYFWISFDNAHIASVTVQYVAFVYASINWPMLWQVCNMNIETICLVGHLKSHATIQVDGYGIGCGWFILISSISGIVDAIDVWWQQHCKTKTGNETKHTNINNHKSKYRNRNCKGKIKNKQISTEQKEIGVLISV